MFDKLVDLLVTFIEVFRLYAVIDEYEEGVVLRFGRYQRTIGPGLHWLIPFYVDRALNDSVVPRVVCPASSAMQTSDGKNIVVSAVITSRIRDIRKALLEVENVDMVVRDSCWSAITTHIGAATWDEIRTEEFANKVTATCRANGFRWGIEIMRVRFGELAPVRIFRLVGGA